MNSDVKIFLNNKEVNYKDWNIKEVNGDFCLTVIFQSNKKYRRPLDEWKVIPTVERKEDLLFIVEKNTYYKIESVKEIGKKYLFITYPDSDKIYLFRTDKVKLKKSETVLESSAFKYFCSIAEERLKSAHSEDEKKRAQNIIFQFNKIVPCNENALYAYLTKTVKQQENRELIYPFGVNETQMKAIKNAFSSQISIIEGPPGTGKTQTILNIIANIVAQGKTCAIVSNNNAAVENVYDKLKKKHLDFLIAKLGNISNKESFFENINYEKPSTKSETIYLQDIYQCSNEIEQYLSQRNELAQKNVLIQELNYEKQYLDEWHKDHPEIDVNYVNKYHLNNKRIMDLCAYIRYLSDRSLTLKNKWDLLIRYRVFRSKFLNKIEDRESFVFSLQYTYYKKSLEKLTKEKIEYEKALEKVDFYYTLNRLENMSLEYLYQSINSQFPKDTPNFIEDNYKKLFHEFVKYFPIIGSSTHSLINSIADGYLLDYVIIDEASQQDLVPGILCLGCAKNVVIVGDRKQLPHIPIPTELVAPYELYNCAKYSLLDSVSEILDNIVPKTMLKEHYRCHPKIIQFCNKQFYDGELIPMTVDKGEDALSLVTTALGNHMRNYKNQREIESVMKADKITGYLDRDETEDGKSVGFIAPYNKQVDLAEDMLSDNIFKSTIHKFQGRECDRIIFSTVLDKKAISKKNLDFVDNESLVNVAVSRAKDKFTLVTGKDVFKNNNKYIAALIRYIEYYGCAESIIDSPVISAFDLLYSEYDASLERLANQLNSKDSKFKSEQIVSALLRKILKLDEFSLLMAHRQIYLKQLIVDSDSYTVGERQYIKNRASCDFVIYYKVGKKPIAVIEVDGGYHDKQPQIARDELKNSILKKAEIFLLRLRTTDAEIDLKIISFLREILNPQKNSE